jgi:integrase
VHTLLQKALSDAVRLEILEKNPALAADAPSRRASRSPVFSTWSPTELGVFLEASKKDEHYPALHLAAFTGLRRSELLGLRWCDLDLEHGELHVVQTVVQVGWQAEFGLPKTERSRRLVALDRQTVNVLREHRRQVEAAVGGSGKVDKDALVFAAPDGAPIHPALFGYRFQRLIKDAGVRRIRFHDLRHMHATHALRAGVHPKIVSERLGHSSISITLDIYSHALPSMQKEAAETIAALVVEPAGD